MKIRQKEIRGFLILLLIASSITLVAFEGVAIAKDNVAEYVYNQTAAPFLTHFSVIAHASKIEPITNKLKK